MTPFSWQRAVIKIGSALISPDGNGCSAEYLLSIAKFVTLSRQQGKEVILVSSGSVAAGKHFIKTGLQASIAEKQAMAAIGQTQMMANWAALFDFPCAQILLTLDDLHERRRYVNIKNTLRELLANQVLPIVNENDTVAVEEIKVGDNDNLAAHTAIVAQADTLIICTDVNGLYDADPRKNPAASLISNVHTITPELAGLAGGAGSSVGTGGMITKLEAAQKCCTSGVQTLLVNGKQSSVFEQLALGLCPGTLFNATMIVNSDERQWTWMDEGLNSFLDGVAGREWDPTIPWGVEPRDITGYMKSSRQVPIMTQSDSVLRLGPNAYTKPAAALNILRETIMGRELFDFAFKEFSQRWKFKRPTPADFFRTMEEASGVDLDWFWRGWFYTTDHVDISLDHVYKLRIDTKDPDIDFARQRQFEMDKPMSITDERNKAEGIELWVDRNEDIADIYDDNDIFTVTNKERNVYNKFLKKLDPWERRVFDRAVKEDKNYYVLDFTNKGGLVMPIILELEFEDGSKDNMYIPAEIWRRTPHAVSKLVITEKDKVLKSVTVDPRWETADVDVENNHYPRRIIPSRIEAYKSDRGTKGVRRDLMQDIKTKLKTDDDLQTDMDNDDNKD